MFRQIPIRPLHFAVGLGLVILIVYRPVFAVNQTTVAMTFLFGIFEARPRNLTGGPIIGWPECLNRPLNLS